jgi:hypothetical protein
LPNYPGVLGVWLDNFEPVLRIDLACVSRHFAAGKDVAIVSPELHPWGRQDSGETLLRYWTEYRETLGKLRRDHPQRRMMICTKFPTLAQEFFNGSA